MWGFTVPIFFFCFFSKKKNIKKKTLPLILLTPLILLAPLILLISSDSSGYSYGGMAFQVILGFICLHFGGQGFIDSCFHWVQQLSWDSVKVGVIIVALGTSLPELVVSLWSLWKKEDILALGNILGSNLLNIWLILGLSRFFLPQGNPALVPSPVLYRDSLFLLGITVLLVLFLFLSRPHLLRKWQGLVFLALYGFYALYLL